MLHILILSHGTRTGVLINGDLTVPSVFFYHNGPRYNGPSQQQLGSRDTARFPDPTKSLFFCGFAQVDGPGRAEVTWLTHFSLDKRAAILVDDIFKCIFVNENDGIPIQISLRFVPISGPTDT